MLHPPPPMRGQEHSCEPWLFREWWAFGSVPLDGEDGKRLFVRFPATNPKVLYLIIYPVRVAV
jgi:hypothetical protein